MHRQERHACLRDIVIEDRYEGCQTWCTLWDGRSGLDVIAWLLITDLIKTFDKSKLHFVIEWLREREE